MRDGYSFNAELPRYPGFGRYCSISLTPITNPSLTPGRTNQVATRHLPNAPAHFNFAFVPGREGIEVRVTDTIHLILTFGRREEGLLR